MTTLTHRTNTRPVKVGNLTIGGNDEIIIQSMTTTKTHDVEATVAEINRLEEAGCQVVRVACPDMRAAEAIADIKARINIPLVVDIFTINLNCTSRAKRTECFPSFSYKLFIPFVNGIIAHFTR